MKTIAHSLFTDFDIQLFRAGMHYRLYEKMGSHLMEVNGQAGCYFAVYAPAATSVHVAGDFTAWNDSEVALYVRWDGSGIWEGFIPGDLNGQRYKYVIRSQHGRFEKADPFARFCERPPQTASIIWAQDYDWQDSEWMKKRKKFNSMSAPFTVYELHPGSWRRNAEENRPLTWREMADLLPAYVHDMGFTHVEFMPVMEYPYDPSWGYQLTGYFAPTSRFGPPEDFKFLVDSLHQRGIGVILDWVPSHFPADAHGLACFDGTAVYEHPDPRKGYHPDWKSMIFNYERPEVRSFLISNALFWLGCYHADGLRVDAVASILYLDYSRGPGEWEPNAFGGRENLDAIGFIKDLNVAVYREYPDVQMIAEESTAFPMVTRPVDMGGLGFGMKWMMGWMHDSLQYFSKDPIHRKFHQNEITFSLAYAFSENFILPISHDEVVYGKRSLLSKMPGDTWQKFANLRLFLGLMYAHPGSKLLFMGCEFGQWDEWNYAGSLDWHLAQHDDHRGVMDTLRKLNSLYRKKSALYERAYSPDGFEWIDFNDAESSVMSFIRRDITGRKLLVVIANMTPSPREGYRVGMPGMGSLKLLLNTDDKKLGGSGFKKIISGKTEDSGWHGRANSISLDLPPLSCLFYEFTQGD